MGSHAFPGGVLLLRSGWFDTAARPLRVRPAAVPFPVGVVVVAAVAYFSIGVLSARQAGGR